MTEPQLRFYFGGVGGQFFNFYAEKKEEGEVRLRGGKTSKPAPLLNRYQRRANADWERHV